MARRAPGTGTASLEAALLRLHGVGLGSVRGPVAPTHLDVAFLVATGCADCGLAVRSAAEALDLDFVPLAWEAYHLVSIGSVAHLVDSLLATLGSDAALRRRITGMAGYRLPPA